MSRCMAVSSSTKGATKCGWVPGLERGDLRLQRCDLGHERGHGRGAVLGAVSGGGSGGAVSLELELAPPSRRRRPS